MQTGFGPFVSVFLTTQKWTQVDIGLVLSAAGFVSLIGQMPGGALVDAARSERLVAGIAVAAICFSALGYATLPIFPMVLSAAVAACAGKLRARPGDRRDQPRPRRPCRISERLGRNARFASIGNGLAAAAMGAVGYFSPRAVFIVTVLLLVPALLALRNIAEAEIDPERAHGASRSGAPTSRGPSRVT